MFQLSLTTLLHIIYCVAFLDMLAVSMIVVILPNYLRDHIGISASISGLIGAIYGIIQFFSGPLIGRFGDVYGHVTILKICLLFCVPAYLMLSWSWLPVVVIARVFAGAFKHTQTLLKTIVGHQVCTDVQLEAFGRLNSMGNIGFILGPLFSGFISEKFGYIAIFVITALMFFICAVFLHFIFSKATFKSDDDAITKSTYFHNGNLFNGMFQMNWSSHWDLFLPRFLLSFAVLLYRSNMNWYLTEVFSVDKTLMGYLTSLQGLVSFVSAFYTKKIASYYSNRVIFFANLMIVMAVSTAGLITSRNILQYAFCLAMLSICSSIMRAIGYELSSERCHSNEIGLVLGLSGSVVAGARAFSPAVGGLLHDVDRNIPILISIFIILFSYICTILFTVRNQRLHSMVKHKIL